MPAPSQDGLEVWSQLTKDHIQLLASFLDIEEPRPSTFTCADCPLVKQCVFAYDPYNTDGDCIAEK